jgi:hypothetical protein
MAVSIPIGPDCTRTADKSKRNAVDCRDVSRESSAAELVCGRRIPTLASLSRLPVPLAVALVTLGAWTEAAAEWAVRAWARAGERRMPRDET